MEFGLIFEEIIFLSCKMIKINEKKERQERIFMLTNRALFNLKHTRTPKISHFLILSPSFRKLQSQKNNPFEQSRWNYG